MFKWVGFAVVGLLMMALLNSVGNFVGRIPWMLTAPIALVTGVLVMTYVCWRIGWISDAGLRAVGMDRAIGWIAAGSAPFKPADAAVQQPVAQQQAAPVEAPPAVRSARQVDPAQLVGKMAERVRGQDALLERLAGDVAVRLGRPPRSIHQPAMSGLVVGSMGKSLVAGELAKALGWPLVVADAGEPRALAARIEAGPAVVVFELDEMDRAGRALFSKLAAGEFAVGGKPVAANQVVVLGLIREEPADAKLRHGVDGVFAVEPLGVRAKVEAVLLGLADAEDQAGVRMQLRDRDVAELARLDLREVRGQLRGVGSQAAAKKLDEAFVEMAAGRLVLAEL